MPNWNDLLNQIRADGAESAHDRVRRKHLARLFKHTQRNVIVYYSVNQIPVAPSLVCKRRPPKAAYFFDRGTNISVFLIAVHT